MPSELSDKQISELKERLDRRFYDLREEIRQELLASDNEQYNQLAGQVHDTGDQSVADLLVDINLAIIDLHVEEIRDIDAALLNISTGNYGICMDCNGDIDYQRLQANPEARRCYTCQTSYEQHYAQKGHPKL